MPKILRDIMKVRAARPLRRTFFLFNALSNIAGVHTMKNFEKKSSYNFNTPNSVVALIKYHKSERSESLTHLFLVQSIVKYSWGAYNDLQKEFSFVLKEAF